MLNAFAKAEPEAIASPPEANPLLLGTSSGRPLAKQNVQRRTGDNEAGVTHQRFFHTTSQSLLHSSNALCKRMFSMVAKCGDMDFDALVTKNISCLSPSLGRFFAAAEANVRAKVFFCTTGEPS
jgi:hypothetical protein